MACKLLKNRVFSAVLIVFCAAVLLLFSLVNPVFSGDEVTNGLLVDCLPRLVMGVAMLFVVAGFDYGLENPFKKGALKLSVLPCFLVALANFPIFALLSGEAAVVREDLLWLFALDCLAIGLSEEVVFRGLVFTVIVERLGKRKHGLMLSVAVSSAIFGLSHLFNLFFGGGFGATMLQVGYSFLIGAMLAFVLAKTANLWLCIFLHALFDFGGKLLSTLGTGSPWEVGFWVLTAIFGSICAVYVTFDLIKHNDSFVSVE